MRERIKVLRRTRLLIAAKSGEFAESVMLPGRRGAADTLVAELIPLLSAIRFLEREACRLLKPRKVGRGGRPLWLSGVTAEIRRDAFGIVLVIAPFNYPLFLPGVQAMQALAAGNAVQVKPAPCHGAPMKLLGACLHEAGLPVGLFEILDEPVEAAQAAIAAGVDKIVLTGSAAAGRAVLGQAALTLTPAIVELSGNDAVFVLGGADPGIVVKALAYGLTLNGGATCIAPRRAFLKKDMLDVVAKELRQCLANSPFFPVAQATLDHVGVLLDQARKCDTIVIGGSIDRDGMTAAVVLEPPADSGLLKEDIFAPVLSLIAVESDEEALRLSMNSPFALGASVFGPAGAARRFAERIDAGVVVVNDLIVPTADPRLPFEGRHRSGFGPTRGREGLLAMTQSRAIAVRRNRLYPHFRKLDRADAGLFAAYIAAAYSGPRRMDRKLANLIKEIVAFAKRCPTRS